MAYTPPQFNLTANIWRSTAIFPPVAPPDVITDCQLYTDGRHAGEVQVGFGAGMIIRFPAGTDVRSAVCGPPADFLECPAGTGRFYSVHYVDDAHKGFANEYRFAVVQQAGTWPAPIP